MNMLRVFSSHSQGNCQTFEAFSLSVLLCYFTGGVFHSHLSVRGVGDFVDPWCDAAWCRIRDPLLYYTKMGETQ